VDIQGLYLELFADCSVEEEGEGGVGGGEGGGNFYVLDI
jgi:hypothetical protein